MKFTLTIDTNDFTMRKILNLCADLKAKGVVESYTPSPEPKDRNDLWDSYELLFILPPDTISSEKNIKEYPTITKLIEIVSKSGGEIEKIESWGKKRLAFQHNLGRIPSPLQVKGGMPFFSYNKPKIKNLGTQKAVRRYVILRA